MYVYFLDKFACQLLEQEESLPFFVTVLEKLAFISPIYILILVQVHEPLIKMLVEKWMTVSHFDEAAQCSMTLMLTQLFEHEILPAVPSYILFFVNKYLLNCLSSAQSLELQVRALALLKKILQCGSGPAEDSEEFELLSLALKKQLLSRRETLSIAVAQCLNIIASNPCYAACLHHVLKSDLPEFLFESLHTMNIAQLDAVVSCLQSFAQSDAFFSRCHAVYGMESLLQMVSTLWKLRIITYYIKPSHF
ncbi:meiosis inhibitor protein 1-like isoform X2 [Pomacea canaliculata]|uniref:meiosis inhibitor protein 1-like isoform X2 n=1 Tax=Pomacea canaliculata TaxID=400727 RepID=UPI000D72D676|nr:meiosis inhibitor protein 1-like isoform X2 [Pomacea canaliculata]